MMNSDKVVIKNLMVDLGKIHQVVNRVVRLFTLVAFGLVVSDLNGDVRFKPKGHEFELTGKLVGDQLETSLSLGPKGGFAVWQDNSTDPFGYGIAAQRIDTLGNPVGSPIRVNSLLEGDQEKPSVGMIPEGGAYFVWEGGASGFHRVHYRVVNSLGVFIAEDNFATTPDSGEQTEPSLVVLKNGSAILSWTDYLADGSHKGVSARVIGKDGQPLTDSFRLNQFNIGNQHKSKVVALPEGGFAAVWVSDQQLDQKSLDIVGRVFSADGKPLTGEVVLAPEGINANPVVALAGNNLVVAWEQLNLKQKQNRWDIAMRSFDLNLKPLSDASLANIKLKGDQFAPQLKGDYSGAMLVWNSLGQDKSREAVMGRFIDTTGRLSENEVVVNTYQDHSQIHPTLTATADKYIVAWSTPRSGDSGFDIVGQRYVAQDSKPLLPAISDLFVNPVSETEMFVSWPKVGGINIKHYELYFNDQVNPKTFGGNYVLWPGLRPGSEYAFRVAYVTEDGRRSELSAFGVNKTWGRDYNEDGLPDDWQNRYFGNKTDNWAGAMEDSDGDGATNQQEFAAGTDPSDSADLLVLDLSKMEEGQRLQWNAQPGAVYQLQQSNEISEEWLNVGEPILASEREAGVTLKSVADMSFYRIKKIR
ncbi:MAG: fibronectin type III domain-containing protein [Verrucomicrobiota bacterium]|nr:fibronectin type III domain-containing protein [Verrucomicrobiota bacterium]